jgi:hypothetical protein
VESATVSRTYRASQRLFARSRIRGCRKSEFRLLISEPLAPVLRLEEIAQRRGKGVGRVQPKRESEPQSLFGNSELAGADSSESSWRISAIRRSDFRLDLMPMSKLDISRRPIPPRAELVRRYGAVLSLPDWAARLRC